MLLHICVMCMVYEKCKYIMKTKKNYRHRDIYILRPKNMARRNKINVELFKLNVVLVI